MYKLLLTLFGFFFFQQSFGGIIPVTIEDLVDPNPDVRLTQSTPFSYSHDINDDGFQSASDSITSMLLTVDLVDDGDYDYTTYSSRRVTTWCGRHSRFGSYHCHYSYRTYTNYGQPEYGHLDIEDESYSLGEIDYGSYIFDITSLMNDLADDGILDITAHVTSGDATFRSSLLTVEVDRTVDVPEPGIISLFGAGLIGLGFSRRRRTKK